jgi:iron complex outermembrane recepter protein
MNQKSHDSTFCFGALLALNLASTAHAQTADALDEIIVTARRVEESMQDVPISITALTPQQISDRNIVVASDLATYTPSLSVNQRYGAEKTTFAIRGFNQDQSTAPTVGVYFADVVGVRSQGGTTSGSTVGAGSFTDLQNVQVLKGPQGTLFGRNTTCGAVLLVPQRPDDSFGGYLEAQAGDYDMRRAQAALNVPMGETFRARLAVDVNEREGFMNNQSGIGPKDYNDVGYEYVRLGAIWDITANLENYTVAHYSNSETNGYASHYKICNPAGAGGAAITGPMACAQLARQTARGDDFYDVEVSNQDPKFLIQTWQVINTTTWRVTDDVTIKNIASYGEFKERSRFNLYSDNFVFGPGFGPLTGTPFTYIELDDAPGDNDTSGQSTITEELQLQGSLGDGRFNWVAGGYLEFSRPIGWNAQRTGILLNCTDVTSLNCSDPLRAGTVSNSRTQFAFDNHGIFAQGTFNFTDQWAFTLGGRYTFDKIEGVGESTRIVGFPGGTTQFCNDTVRFRGTTPANTIPSSGALIVSDPSQCRLELETESNEPTWLAGVDYKPTDDVLIYGKYARGYRQGGLSFTNIGLETWEPEQVDSYEVGTKFSFAADAASGFINFAAFYNDFQDQQIFAATIAKPGAGAQAGAAVIVNAGQSVIQGFEVDSTIQLFEYLRLDLGYAYLDTELKELTTPVPPADSPFSALIPTAQVGSPLTLSPEHRLTGAVTFTLPLPETIGKLSLGATYVYTDEQIANGSTPASIGVLPSTDIVNVNLNWTDLFATNVDAGLFMTNATDEEYFVNTGGGYVSSGIGDVLMGAPRMYGVRVRYSFGE